MADYSTYPIFSLLNILWETWEQIHALDALISIDTLHIYEAQRHYTFDVACEVRTSLRQKWLAQLPPLLPFVCIYFLCELNFFKSYYFFH